MHRERSGPSWPGLGLTGLFPRELRRREKKAAPADIAGAAFMDATLKRAAALQSGPRSAWSRFATSGTPTPVDWS